MRNGISIAKMQCLIKPHDDLTKQANKTELEKVKEQQNEGSYQREELYQHKLAYYHMKLALIFLDNKQPDLVIILCDRALSAMLKATYIKTHSTLFLPKYITMTDQLYLLQSESVPALEVVIFIGTIQYLANDPEINRIKNMKKKNIRRLIRKTDEILCFMSQLIIDDPAELYQSIF
ncbi:hypothetical protein [Paenibacillus medicaginis]|uniref:Uncharacterized protein n=1 Tax=Paenibacillus medicaginis TaxID=1470560 RepID=A0ABV5C2W7_9BACL